MQKGSLTITTLMALTLFSVLITQGASASTFGYTLTSAYWEGTNVLGTGTTGGAVNYYRN